MTKLNTCKKCKKLRKYYARGMCKQCYNKWYNYKTKKIIPHTKNKSCGMYLGCHIAEQILSKVFKNVNRMPITTPGYDFICNNNKKIDVKSSCLTTTRKNKTRWNFHIKKNKIADAFLCIAFDNRTDLNPLHLWLIPKSIINKHTGASISISTLHKWDEYKLDIAKTLKCCNSLKHN